MSLKIAGKLKDSGSSPRTGKPIIYLIVHHAATTSQSAFFATLEGTAREVTCNFAIARGKTYRQVHEGRRAWTSGAWMIDDQALTVETLNTTGEPSWQIGADDYDQLAELALYMHEEYDMPLTRAHIIGHGELLSRFGVSYATACPGGIDIDRIITLARTKKAGGLTMADMQTIEKKLNQIIATQKSDKKSIDSKITILANIGRWIKTRLGGSTQTGKSITALLGDASTVDFTAEELAAAMREELGEFRAREVAQLLTITTKES